MSAASTSSIDAIVEPDSGAVDPFVVVPGLLLCELAGPCCPRFPDFLESLLGDVEAPELRVVADEVAVVAFFMSLTLAAKRASSANDKVGLLDRCPRT